MPEKPEYQYHMRKIWDQDDLSRFDFDGESILSGDYRFIIPRDYSRSIPEYIVVVPFHKVIAETGWAKRSYSYIDHICIKEGTFKIYFSADKNPKIASFRSDLNNFWGVIDFLGKKA